MSTGFTSILPKTMTAGSSRRDAASLVAAIINGKFNNHLPLERQSRCYKDSGVNLETNTMFNWMMRATEIHLNILYEELLKVLIDFSLIHADES